MTPINFNPGQIEYRLGGGHGCAGKGSAARSFSSQRKKIGTLTWFGRGLADVGIEAGSALTPEQFPLARNLMAGRHPHTGEQLVKPKLGVYEDAKLPIAPLVRAIHAVAHEADVPVAEVLLTPKSLAAFRAAERAVAAKGEAALLRADEAGELADAASLNVDEVWTEGRFASAVSCLWETVSEVGADGKFTERRRKRRRVVGNAGYDVTVELDKETSLLLAFAHEQAAEELEGVFLRAMETAFRWLEDTTAYARRGKHGGGRTAEVVQGNGFLGWYMVHPAARPVNGAAVGDPHWHVHLNLANLVLASDSWSTIAAGGRDLMRHVPALQQLVHALVRRELQERFGAAYEREQGARSDRWRLVGIPLETVDRFSKRHNDIEDALTRLGYDPATASRAQHRIAEQRTRNVKTDAAAHADASLQELWQQEERAAGGTPDEYVRRVLTADQDRLQQPPAADVRAIANDLLDPTYGLTAHSRRFSRADALRRVAAALPSGVATPAELEALTDEVLTHPGFIELPAAKGSGGSGMRNAVFYTTEDVVAAEKVILRAAKASAPEQSDVRVTDERTLELSLAVTEASLGFALADEQRVAVIRLLTEGRAVDVVNGAPGSGKSTLMRAVRVAFESEGYVVAGAATAAVAALNLQAHSGIESRTIASYVHAIKQENSTALQGVDVLVVDEANLTNDRDRAVLYQRAEETGTRIVEIGDFLQLRGVGVGSLFGRVFELVGGAELKDNRRQAKEDERLAIESWRAARYAEAFTSWAGEGRLVATEDRHEAIAAMLAKWWEKRVGAPDPHTEMRGLVMLAATNAAVTRLNEAAQGRRLAEGELGAAHRYALIGGRTKVLHVGDHILLRTNAWNRAEFADTTVLNGYRGVIRAIAPDGTITAEWQLEGRDGIETRTGRLTAAYVAAGGVDLGYALTVHKSEGLTVGDQWVAADGEPAGGTVLFAVGGADNPAMHVATTRHRQDVWIFASRDQFETEQQRSERGIPKSREERTYRAVERLAERARATEESPDDVPVVVQLGLEEFAAEGSASETERQSGLEEDAVAARRESERLRRERDDRRDEVARRQVEAQRRDRAAALLREVWRHEPVLVELIIAGSGFDAVARRVTEIIDESHLDIHEVLAELSLDALAADAVVDKARFAAWAIRDSAERIVSGRAERDRELARRRRELAQMRDQAADLLREAWRDSPGLAEDLISAPTFDAVVRALDHHCDGALSARQLLERLPTRKIEPAGIVDKGRFTAYLLAQIAERERLVADREQRLNDRVAAERHWRRVTSVYLRDAWPSHSQAVRRVVEGPAFPTLASRVAEASDDGVSVPDVLAEISPERLTRPEVRDASALATALFTTAVRRRKHEGMTESRGTEPMSWRERKYGHLDDVALREALQEAERHLNSTMEDERSAHLRAADVRAAVELGEGKHARETHENLRHWQDRAAVVAEVRRLEVVWQEAAKRVADLAAARGNAEHELDGLGVFSPRRRAELTTQIADFRAKEAIALAKGRELALRVAGLQDAAGPVEQHDRVLVRARAAEMDLPHALGVAQQRDAKALDVAERHAARVSEQVRALRGDVLSIKGEQKLRQQMPADLRVDEEQQRARLVGPVQRDAVVNKSDQSLRVDAQPAVLDVELEQSIEPRIPER